MEDETLEEANAKESGTFGHWSTWVLVTDPI